MARPAADLATDPSGAVADRMLVKAARELLSGLDPDVIQALLDDPEAFRDAALRATGRDPELDRVAEPALSIEEGRRRLVAARVPAAAEPAGETVGATELARRLGLASRQTIYDRMTRRELVGFDLAGKHRFPLAQFDGRGRVLPGIAQVLELLGPLGDGHAAWRWLSRPSVALDGRTPLQSLQGDAPRRVTEVVAAASTELDGTYR